MNSFASALIDLLDNATAAQPSASTRWPHELRRGTAARVQAYALPKTAFFSSYPSPRSFSLVASRAGGAHNRSQA